MPRRKATAINAEPTVIGMEGRRAVPDPEVIASTTNSTAPMAPRRNPISPSRRPVATETAARISMMARLAADPAAAADLADLRLCIRRRVRLRLEARPAPDHR